MCSSTVCKLTKRITFILSFYLIKLLTYPNLWARLIAYKSLKGLKSLSINIIVLAEVRFMPYPPALVESKNNLQF